LILLIKNVKMKKVYCFDFDGTLFDTPQRNGGVSIWKSKVGKEWPHIGWWSKPETLDDTIFNIEVRDEIIEKYREAKLDKDSHIILATGRIENPQMRKMVEHLLDRENLKFKGIYLNDCCETFKFKSNLFSKIIEQTKCDEFIMYDDREEHLRKFELWALRQNCLITIVNSVTMEEKKINLFF
jgi:hypothetical protein